MFFHGALAGNIDNGRPVLLRKIIRKQDLHFNLLNPVGILIKCMLLNNLYILRVDPSLITKSLDVDPGTGCN